MAFHPIALTRHLTRDNPLFVRRSLAGRRARLVRALSVTLLLILVTHGLTAAFLVRIMGWAPVIDDPIGLWMVNLFSPSLVALLIPLLPLLLLPNATVQRAASVELRLAGLTPGQICAGQLRPAGAVLLTYQALWLSALVLLSFEPTVARQLAEFWESAGTFFGIGGVFVDGLITPWALLLLLWSIGVSRGTLLSAAAVAIPLAIVLNPLAVLFLIQVMIPFATPEETLVNTGVWTCVVVKSGIAAFHFRSLHRRFDSIIAESPLGTGR
jgi:hypothetical protein